VAKFECDVFLSYKREEKARVEQLAQKLRSVGLKVWFDGQLRSGENFDEEIAGHLRASRMSMVCWTPGAIGSTWVRAEASMAHQSGKLVAAFLEPTELIPPFNLIQTEDLSDWNGEDDHAGWARLLTRIASLSEDPDLTGWARLMNEGDANRLRAWANAAPVGPLRATTRFRLSEIVSTGSPGPARRAAPAKNGVKAPMIAIMASVVALAAGSAGAWAYVQRNDLAAELSGAVQKITALESAASEDKLIASKLENDLAEAQNAMQPYAEIERLRRKAFELVNRIEDLLARRRPDS
jgi:hypothetical protein